MMKNLRLMKLKIGDWVTIIHEDYIGERAGPYRIIAIEKSVFKDNVAYILDIKSPSLCKRWTRDYLRENKFETFYDNIITSTQV
jgi:hypothetical protein